MDRSATFDEIRSSYRRLAKKYHPDLNPGDEEASEKIKEVNLAYEVLSDDEKRKQYDMYGNAVFDGGAGGGHAGGFDDLFGSIFNDFFGGGGGGFGYSSSYNVKRPSRGRDIEEVLDLDFREAVFGVEKEVTVQRKEVCPDCKGSGAEEGSEVTTCEVCHGSGQVHTRTQTPLGVMMRTETCASCKGTGEKIEKPCQTCKSKKFVYRNRTLNADIPAGVDTGNFLRLSGEGDVGENGGPNGDVYIHIRVKPHEFFQRDGADVYYKLPIRFVQAALGDEIEVPTLEGMEEFIIPKGTQSGEVFTLKGKGIQRINSTGKGDIHIEVAIQTPTKLSSEQEELLREFDSGDKEGKKERKGFFEKVKSFFD